MAETGQLASAPKRPHATSCRLAVGARRLSRQNVSAGHHQRRGGEHLGARADVDRPACCSGRIRSQWIFLNELLHTQHVVKLRELKMIEPADYDAWISYTASAVKPPCAAALWPAKNVTIKARAKRSGRPGANHAANAAVYR